MQSAKESFLEIVSALGNSKSLYEHEINAVIDELNIVESLRNTIVKNGEKKTERELILDKSFKCFLTENNISSRFQTAFIKQLRLNKDIITLTRFRNDKMTVRDFITTYDIEKIQNIKHVGDKTIYALIEALKKYDLYINGGI